jgi:hypothetical protein
MYCVIQEIKTKKANKNGHPKELKSSFMKMSFQGQDLSHYYHSFSEERFERPIKKAYKISIHVSYREHGKVKKKQYVLCTVNYYDLADGCFTIYDYCNTKITALSKTLNVSVEELYEIVEAKINPLSESTQKEYEETEEFTACREHDRITTMYAINKIKFKEKYGCDDNRYDQIYDVFGNLMNQEKLDETIAESKARKEYEKKSRSYQEQNYNNYNKYFSGNGGSGYSGSNYSNHESGDKETLKQFYRVLSKKFHPDSNPNIDTSKEMKLLNQLKSEWNI